MCSAYGIKTVKALRTGPGLTKPGVAPYAAFAVLLDGYQPGLRGGTGARSDWDLAADLVRSGFRVILAGGLGPDNLGEALAAVHPLAVDLNSGVEIRPGIKDHALLHRAMAVIAGGKPRTGEERPW